MLTNAFAFQGSRRWNLLHEIPRIHKLVCYAIWK